MRAADLDLSSMTEEDVIKAMLRDDELYAELALHIVSDGKVVAFEYNQPQRIFNAACEEQLATKGKVQMLVLKARQMGLSTAIQGRGFKRVTTRPNYRMEVISHDDDSSTHILGMSKLFLDTLPGPLRPMVQYNPKASLYFANPDRETRISEPGLRSHITVTSAKNARAGRSKTPHFLHFSEVAFYQKDAAKLVGGYMQGLPDGIETEAFIESTANGNEGYFYELWREAVKGRSGWYPLFIPWWQMQKYRAKPPSSFQKDKEEERLVERFGLDDEQLWWRRQTLKNKCSGDLLLFKQEYPSDWMEAFQSSGSKFFPALTLQNLFDKEEREAREKPPRRGTLERDEKGKPKWVDDPAGWCIMHKEPAPDMAYIVTVDTSEGTEDEAHDPSGLLVTTAPNDPGRLEEEVFEYNGYLDPDQLGHFAVLVGEYYNWAFVCHEDNHHGIIVSHILRQEAYPSVYEREHFDEVAQEVTTKLGFHTDAKTKPYILNLLKADIRDGKYVPRTTSAIEELLAFKKSKSAFKGGMYSGNAQPGAHDERVMIRAMNRMAAQVAPRALSSQAFDYEKAQAHYARR